VNPDQGLARTGGRDVDLLYPKAILVEPNGTHL
jgi:hypothetical protein